MNVGFAQFAPSFGEKDSNVQRTIDLITEAVNTDLLVLPELCSTGYLFEDKSEVKKMAEVIPDGKTVKVWEKAAAETNTYIVAGICEKAKKEEYYNSAVLIGPEGYIDTYRKIQLFNTEKDLFLPGDGPFKIYDIGLSSGKLGFSICSKSNVSKINRK
ncbi:MAG: nitrilase-related carbon-nitrogen hydrolase [Candidatus Heimdallarchaeota archaeon]